jgi:hypothetical protein
MDTKPSHQLLELAGLLSALERPWYVAGGWAIELYLQECRRTHKDVDIAVFRSDQLIFQRYFLDKGWKLSKYVGNSEAVEPWLPGEKLRLPDRGLFAEPPNRECSCLDILLSERKGENWWYHRDPRITHPVKTVGIRSDLGISFLSPEIVLLFKARHISVDEPNYILHRQKDENDFQAVQKLLNVQQRAWLEKSIRLLYPDHPWLKDLMRD